MFVTPEHSRSITAVLKNAIDWGARPWGKSSWPGKPAAVIGTSGGAISTAVAQQHLRAVLGGQGLHLLGGEAYIQFKPDLIDAESHVTDDNVRGFLKAFVDRFAAFAAKVAPERAQRAA
jgi:chromate reductase